MLVLVTPGQVAQGSGLSAQTKSASSGSSQAGTAACRFNSVAPRRISRLTARWCSLALVALAAGSTSISPQATAAPPGAAPVMTMYVPFAEQQISDGLFSIYTAGAPGAADIVSTISVTSSAAGAVMYWDHWEDGYEADLTTPTSPTTQVWGDGVVENGMRPGAVDAAGDVIGLGEVIFLQDFVELPRDPAQVFFDGRDKVASTRGFSLSRAGWDSGIGPAHAGAVAATDTSKFGTRFDVPIGEDAGYGAFDYTGLSVMVAEDDTTIDIDLGGDGTIDQTHNADEGESVFVDGDVSVGTTVRTTKASQVHLITGRRDSRYEGRWYEVFPAETLDDEYVAAAGSFSATQLVTVFVFNPHADPITVAVDAAGTADDTDLVIAGREVSRYDIPNGSGAHFESPGNQFSAVSGTVAVVGSTVAYDWGHTLVPVSSLTPAVFVGWGAGSPSGTASNSPVWAAPLAFTTIYVDLDADGTPDQTFADVDAYESVRIVDPDHDLTGANVYTTDGTPLSVAWGQDAALEAGNAYDLGTAVLPTAALITTKNAQLVGDTNGDGVVDPGDILRFTIRNSDAGALALTDLAVVDDLPNALDYVTGSTTIDDVALADDTSGTPFPLDGSGRVIPLIDPGGAVDVVFDAAVATTFPFFVDSVANTVTVTASQSTSTATSITSVRPISPASIGDFVWLDRDGDGDIDPDEPGIDGLVVTIVGPSHPTGASITTVDGNYRFDGLVPGDYVVTIDRSSTSALPATSYRSAGSDSATLTITSGQTVDTVDFGYVVPGSVSGVLFHDIDINGSIGPGDAILSGATVTITGPGLPPEGRSQTTNTDATYLFAGLDAGTFTVVATPSGDLPAHFVITNADAGAGGGRVAVTTAIDHTTNVDLGFHDPAPEAHDDSFEVDAESTLVISDLPSGLLANDGQGNGPALIADFDTASANGGVVTVVPDGTFTYTPPAGFVGSDTFVYTIRDTSGDESSATVTIQVNGIARIDGVVWHDSNASGTIDSDEVPFAGVQVQLAGSGTDCADQTADDLLPIIVLTSADGAYSFDRLGPGCHEVQVITGTMPGGVRSATYDIDGGLDAASTVEIVGTRSATDVDFGFVNLVPRAAADSATTDEGVPVTISPITNDVDPEGQRLTIASVSSSANGTASIDGATITYSPAPGFDGTDWLVYTVCDPDGECATAAVNVTVTNTNDPPKIAASGATIDVVIGKPVAPLAVADAEGDQITTHLAGGQLPNGLTLNSDGTFAGLPTGAGQPAGTTTTFSVELCDARGACSTVSFSMTIRAAPASTNSGSIPNSGTESGLLLWWSSWLVLLGMALWAVSARSRERLEPTQKATP